MSLIISRAFWHKPRGNDNTSDTDTAIINSSYYAKWSCRKCTLTVVVSADLRSCSRRSSYVVQNEGPQTKRIAFEHM